MVIMGVPLIVISLGTLLLAMPLVGAFCWLLGALREDRGMKRTGGAIFGTGVLLLCAVLLLLYPVRMTVTKA